MATGTSSSSYSTQWSSGHNQDSSSRHGHLLFQRAFDELLFKLLCLWGRSASSVSAWTLRQARLSNTLNESSTSMSTSKAISVNIPQFGYAAKCCNYAFGGYVFGLKNTREPCRRGRLHRRPDARERWLYCRKQSRQWKTHRYCRHRPDLCGISRRSGFRRQTPTTPTCIAPAATSGGKRSTPSRMSP